MVGKLDNISKDIDCRIAIRNQYELLYDKLKLLRAEDRVLLELYFQHSVSLGQLSMLIGIEPQNVARRIKKTVGRLFDNNYIYFLRHKNRFSSRQMQIAYDHFLLGQGRSTIAAKREMPVGEVNRELKYLRLCLSQAQKLN